MSMPVSISASIGHPRFFGASPLDKNIGTTMDMFKMVVAKVQVICWSLKLAATMARGWKGLTVTNFPIKATSIWACFGILSGPVWLVSDTFMYPELCRAVSVLHRRVGACIRGPST